MSFASQSFLNGALRHILMLCVVVGMLAPQALRADMMGAGNIAIAQDVCAEKAHHAHMSCETTPENFGHVDHDPTSKSACAGMTCFCAPPFEVSQVTSSDPTIIMSVATPGHDAPSGTSPAMLRKPPKHV